MFNYECSTIETTKAKYLIESLKSHFFLQSAVVVYCRHKNGDNG